MSYEVGISFEAGGTVSAGPYPEEILPDGSEDGGYYGHDDNMIDNGTMPLSKRMVADAVVGHKIVAVERKNVRDQYDWEQEALVITLDNGTQAQIIGEGDCCAYTEVKNFVLHADKIDHIVTGVGTTGKYTTWHFYADFGDVMEMTVEWSCGNPFYYAYGFNVEVVPVDVP